MFVRLHSPMDVDSFEKSKYTWVWVIYVVLQKRIGRSLHLCEDYDNQTPRWNERHRMVKLDMSPIIYHAKSVISLCFEKTAKLLILRLTGIKYSLNKTLQSANLILILDPSVTFIFASLLLCTVPFLEPMYMRSLSLLRILLLYCHSCDYWVPCHRRLFWHLSDDIYQALVYCSLSAFPHPSNDLMISFSLADFVKPHLSGFQINGLDYWIISCSKSALQLHISMKKGCKL